MHSKQCTHTDIDYYTCFDLVTTVYSKFYLQVACIKYYVRSDLMSRKKYMNHNGINTWGWELWCL